MPCLTIGLTGGVASGKSHVAALFERLGTPVLDADQVSRDVVAPPSPVLQRIAERFGADILQGDGTLDRPRLRAIVFADGPARRDLEAITHPAIRERIAAWLGSQHGPYCILANAILIESGMAALVDRVLVVDAAEEVQLARLQRRDGMELAAGQRMLAAQTSRSRRLARADDVIDNADDQVDLRPAVARLHRLYLQLGGRC
jgi:dephospho-CoA kinase